MAIYNGGLSVKNVSVSESGAGNAITSLSADGNVITATKGSTFLTKHQDISGKEDKSNKVTAWSPTTTHEHYPSEKLVKGALDTKVNTGDVLTLGQIQATTDLTGKVASASALKEVVTLDLLWTNENPYSNFPEQTISLDLSKYEVIAISVCDYGADVTRRDIIQTTFILKNVNSHIFCTYLHQDINSMRSVSASDDSIYFSGAVTSSGSSNNTTAIPQKIWGII